ncbi:MAG: hypothetical protein H6867_08995 [Rhodospirillales bacterium]|nr:hypothetical protein [Rhodospirillales bacterium]MCB9996058.1 hypothetical protein [Rhodospirillales bacterium]
MRVSRLAGIKEIEDFYTLYASAHELSNRAHRLRPKEDGSTRLDPAAISEIFNAARRLHLIGVFDNEASQLPFIRHLEDVLAGARPASHNEAVEALNYIRNALEHSIG